MMRTSLTLAILVAFPACGDDGGGGGPADGSGGAGDGAGGADARPAGDGGLGGGESGRVFVSERNWYGTTSGYVFGELMTGGLHRYHTETMAAGACRLLEYEPAFCDPPCYTGLCSPGNVCGPYPTYLSAGTLTITGLRQPLSVTPVGCGFCDGEQYWPQSQLPEDLFAPDATVTASAPGAAFPAFSVTAGAVPTLEATFPDDKITIQDGVDFTLRWTAGDGDARVRVILNANNAGHGAPYAAILECDGPDTGSIVIPGALISAFPSTMAWQACAGSDCPPSRVMRYRRGTTEAGGGVVELLVASEVLFGVDHNP
jgi:hypothetical protein